MHDVNITDGARSEPGEMYYQVNIINQEPEVLDKDPKMKNVKLVVDKNDNIEMYTEENHTYEDGDEYNIYGNNRINKNKNGFNNGYNNGYNNNYSNNTNNNDNTRNDNSVNFTNYDQAAGYNPASPIKKSYQGNNPYQGNSGNNHYQGNRGSPYQGNKTTYQENGENNPYQGKSGNSPYQGNRGSPYQGNKTTYPGNSVNNSYQANNAQEMKTPETLSIDQRKSVFGDVNERLYNKDYQQKSNKDEFSRKIEQAKNHDNYYQGTRVSLRDQIQMNFRNNEQYNRNGMSHLNINTETEGNLPPVLSKMQQLAAKKDNFNSQERSEPNNSFYNSNKVDEIPEQEPKLSTVELEEDDDIENEIYNKK